MSNLFARIICRTLAHIVWRKVWGSAQSHIWNTSSRTQEANLRQCLSHYDDVIMGAIASQITSLTIVYSTDYSDADHRKHQSSASLAFVNYRGPVNSPHKWPVTRKMFPFDDVIMSYSISNSCLICDAKKTHIWYDCYDRWSYNKRRIRFCNL